MALLIETSRVYGRGLLTGVGQYHRLHGPWSIEFDEGDLLETVPDWFKSWRGDGVIARVKTYEMAKAIAKLKVPAVDLYGCLPDIKMPQLRSDAEAVGRLAAQHLLERGFRHFAFCGQDGVDWSDLRRSGFERCVAEAGFKCDVFESSPRTQTNRIPRPDAHNSDYELRLGQWLRTLPKPVGVMGYNDVRGRQLLSFCRNLGMAVPYEVAVIGVDNDAVLCELSDLPLSSVMLDAHTIGYEAAALLDRMMAGEKPAQGRLLLAPKGIATRHSTDVLAIEDRKLTTALRFIRERACEGIGVSDVLKAVPLARCSLERQFSRIVGHSPHAEILRVKLGRAKQLLIDSDLSLPDVAAKAGFHYAEYMSRIFKIKTGLTPGQFRNQARPQPALTGKNASVRRVVSGDTAARWKASPVKTR